MNFEGIQADTGFSRCRQGKTSWGWLWQKMTGKFLNYHGNSHGNSIDRWIYGGNFHRSLGLWRITYTITMYIGRFTCLLKVNDRCLTVGPKKATSPKKGPCENRAPQSWWFPSMILMNKSGWWFQPLWNIWVRQLGWLFPIYGNIKDVPNHQPVMIFEESIRINLHLSDMPNIY